jgi:hypothetical protein
MTRTHVTILVLNLGRRSETGREKRVTPEFGERKEEKILPPKFRALQARSSNIWKRFRRANMRKWSLLLVKLIKKAKKDTDLRRQERKEVRQSPKRIDRKRFVIG